MYHKKEERSLQIIPAKQKMVKLESFQT